MPHNERDRDEDHHPEELGIGQPQGSSFVSPGVLSGALPAPVVPMAEPITNLGEEMGALPTELTPNPEGPFPSTFPFPVPGQQLPIPFPRPCSIKLRAGCYMSTFRPNTGFSVFRGTMRVDNSNGQTVVSGDLYRFLDFPFPFPLTPAGPGLGMMSLPKSATVPVVSFPRLHGIPIYPRSQYYSYLKITGIEQSPFFTFRDCKLTLTAEEYVYTQPPAGSFNGTFPAAPGTRTVRIVLSPVSPPLGFTSSYFEGKLYEGGVEKGTFTMGWVSSYFRRATIEVDTLVGAVAPQAVPASTGTGTEDIRTVFASAGWSVTVLYDQTGIPVPAGVNANACWAGANLHALMLAVRNPAADLDAEWRMHLVVVPATIGCGRGVMYDVITVPREGVASFCDDGYPSSDSLNFGAAANQQQRNVPRAFLRSACHELGHGFNQIHQEQEGGADNSIMTTTPSVADALGGPFTGEPGVFPTEIALHFNDHVRHHLVHFPDIVVRPGGMTFGTGHSSTVPQADRYYFAKSQLDLTLEAPEARIELGEPLQLAWTLTNTSDQPIPVPSQISAEAQHALITVIDPNGGQRPMPSFIIQTDNVTITLLEPGESFRAASRVFWSSRGFAFERPGKYVVEVRVVWSIAGVSVGVKASTDVWVNYPESLSDNDAAATLLHPQVGMFVALGGGAEHLTEAVDRIAQVRALQGVGDRPAAKALRAYEDLLRVVPRERVPDRGGVKVPHGSASRAGVGAGNKHSRESGSKPHRKSH
jgi:hypothetical protein